MRRNIFVDINPNSKLVRVVKIKNEDKDNKYSTIYEDFHLLVKNDLIYVNNYEEIRSTEIHLPNSDRRLKKLMTLDPPN